MNSKWKVYINKNNFKELLVCSPNKSGSFFVSGPWGDHQVSTVYVLNWRPTIKNLKGFEKIDFPFKLSETTRLISAYQLEL